MIKVLDDRVLIEEKKVTEQKTSGGIIMIQSNTTDYSTPKENKVIAIGTKVQYIKVGDTVMYLPRTGVILKRDENTTWVIMKEEDIIAITQEASEVKEE